jgi:hypothetical protein
MLGKGYLCAVVTQDAWQTPTTNMDMVRSEEGVQKRIAFRASIGRKSIPDGNLGEQMQRVHGLPAPANPSTDGSRQGLWPTVTAHTPDMESSGPNGHAGTYLAGAVKSWATPNTMDCLPPKSPEALARNLKKGGCRNLREDVVYRTEQWGTPTTRDHKSGRGNEEREYKELTPMVERTQNGKLNPRWVETLMGLPIGWTMPSCASPVTIELMNSDSSATESCQQPQSEHSEF